MGVTMRAHTSARVAKKGRFSVRAFAGLALLLLGLGGTPEAVAEEVAGLLRLRPPPEVLTTPRDPLEFLDDLTPVMPRPVVIMTRRDAVAQEILANTRSLSEAEALRTAQALCHEAETLGWDPFLFVAVIHIESYFDHLAVSRVGAEGLMQLMPVTAEWMAAQLELSWPDRQSFDPVLNVRLGAQYLAYLKREFRGLDEILTAYNRGPKATRYLLEKYGSVPRPIQELYAGRVLERYQRLRAIYGYLPTG